MTVMRGTDIAKEILERDWDEVLVYFDPDVDGLFAGLIPYRYFEERNIPVQFYINNNRGHGFLLEDYSYWIGKLILMVDAHIPESKVRELVSNGVTIVNIDHHDCQSTFIDIEIGNARGIVINNQYPFEREDKRYLSGTGVVYEVFEEIWGTDKVEPYKCTVGITLLSDIREIGCEDSIRYLEYTYSDKSDYARYLAISVRKVKENKYAYGIPRLTSNFIGFTLSPILNSLLRFNKGDIAVNFVLQEGQLEYYVDLQKAVIDELMGTANVYEYPYYTFVIIDDTIGERFNTSTSNFIGLVANQFLNNDVSCVVCASLRDKKIVRASFRSDIFTFDFRGEFVKAGLTAIGHSGAFGILDLHTDKNLMYKLNVACEMGTKNRKPRRQIEVSNMSTFRSFQADSISRHNDFSLEANKTYVHYTGFNIKMTRGTEKYTRYTFDGISVIHFGPPLENPQDYLISVTRDDNRVLAFYLTDTLAQK